MTQRPRRPRRHRARLPLVAFALVVVGALAWVGLRVANRNGDPSPRVVADEAGVSHVHGLGVNPADGSLIIATHHGSFRIAEDGETAERIGDSFQDTMGFTVAGPDHFLGSGHPDVAAMQAGRPTRLGLIESTDAGETWSILSLGGAADFHALAYAHGQVYGWDAASGRFMVSADMRAWETRSTVDLYGFAVDPQDADHIIAARPDGLQHGGLIESVDGGRTWNDVDGPDLVVVSWHADGGLWGAEQGGLVWHRGSSGWAQRGELSGSPQGFLATADALYAAIHDTDDRTAIYRSTDDGRTWDLRYRDPAP